MLYCIKEADNKVNCKMRVSLTESKKPWMQMFIQSSLCHELPCNSMDHRSWWSLLPNGGGGGGQNFSCQLFIKLRLSNGTSNDVRLLRFAFGWHLTGKSLSNLPLKWHHHIAASKQWCSFNQSEARLRQKVWNFSSLTARPSSLRIEEYFCQFLKLISINFCVSFFWRGLPKVRYWLAVMADSHHKRTMQGQSW